MNRTQKAKKAISAYIRSTVTRVSCYFIWSARRHDPLQATILSRLRIASKIVSIEQQKPEPMMRTSKFVVWFAKVHKLFSHCLHLEYSLCNRRTVLSLLDGPEISWNLSNEGIGDVLCTIRRHNFDVLASVFSVTIYRFCRYAIKA